jgi:hypothetical protein
VIRNFRNFIRPENSISVEIIIPQLKQILLLLKQFTSGTNCKKILRSTERTQSPFCSTAHFLAVPIVFHRLASSSNYQSCLTLAKNDHVSSTLRTMGDFLLLVPSMSSTTTWKWSWSEMGKCMGSNSGVHFQLRNECHEQERLHDGQNLRSSGLKTAPET